MGNSDNFCQLKSFISVIIYRVGDFNMIYNKNLTFGQIFT